MSVTTFTDVIAFLVSFSFITDFFLMFVQGGIKHSAAVSPELLHLCSRVYFRYLCTSGKLAETETEIHGERASIAGKFLRVRKVFAREISFCPFLLEMVWSSECSESFRIVCRTSGLSGKILDCLESLHII